MQSFSRAFLRHSKLCNLPELDRTTRMIAELRQMNQSSTRLGSQGANALQRYRNNLFVHFGLLDVGQIPPLRIRGKTSVAHPRRRSHFPT